MINRCIQFLYDLRGGGENRFSDRRISQKKLFGFLIWRIFYTNLRILLIQRIADLSNILARIVDLACNLVRILDCDFSRAFSGSKFRQDHCRIANFASNLGGSADLYTPIHPPPPSKVMIFMIIVAI
jgi:hypothetical protein